MVAAKLKNQDSGSIACGVWGCFALIASTSLGTAVTRKLMKRMRD